MGQGFNVSPGVGDVGAVEVDAGGVFCGVGAGSGTTADG